MGRNVVALLELAGAHGLHRAGLLALGLLSAGVALGGSQRQTIQIPSLLGDGIPAVLSVPDGPVPADRFPACVVLHGSGGLLKENQPGDPCGPDLENNYELLFQTLEARGVVVLAPNSFGRSPLFCEDNDDAFFSFVPPPFHNPGDGVPARDDAYSARRIETRTLDAGGALAYLQQQSFVDPLRICIVGTSNGGSAALVMSSNATGRHAAQFGDISQQRPHESAGDYAERQVIFANYPALPPALESAFNGLPVPKFTQAISPGCFVRKMIPTVDPNGFNLLMWPDDVFHPQDARDGYAGNEFHAEIGGDDGVPDHCRPAGIRHRQALAYQMTFGVSPPRWLPTEYPGFGHDLLGDNPAIIAKFDGLVIHHFFDGVFADQFENAVP